MREFLLSFLVLLGTTFVSAQAVERLEIRNGQQKTAKTGGVTVKFLELLEDSRCPSDVNCVWAGVARIKVRLSKNGKFADLELNTNQADKPAVYGGYSVALKDLNPRQSSTSRYSPSAYSATFTISKSKTVALKK